MNKSLPSLKFDGDALWMAFDSAEVRLALDGTFRASAGITADEIIAIFQPLEPPDGGRVWWKIFAANTIFEAATDGDFQRVSDFFQFGNNEKAAARNSDLIAWILKEEIHRVLSFSVFADIRKHLWVGRPHNCPRTNPIAKKLLTYARKHPHPSRVTMMALAKR